MATRGRGRPRAFDEEHALEGALEVFLTNGFHEAKLDDLAAGMGINKPSLYGAFGDKSALYERVVRDYMARIRDRIPGAFESGDLRLTMQRLLDGALEQFQPQGRDRMGCLIVSTLSTAAGTDPQLRERLRAFVREMDALLERLFAEHFPAELESHHQSPKQLAGFFNDLVYALALRARAGVPREELRRHAHSTLDLLLGNPDR